MPVSRYSTVVATTLLISFFALDAYFGDDAGNPRFNGAFYESATYAPRPDEAVVEFRSARDATPADRIKDVFGQFVPSDSRRGKRYSSAAATIIR